jgi:hypothetical protein
MPVEDQTTSETEARLAEALYFQMERLDPSEEGCCFAELPSDAKAFYRHAIMGIVETYPELVLRALVQVKLRRQLLRRSENPNR